VDNIIAIATNANIPTIINANVLFDISLYLDCCGRTVGTTLNSLQYRSREYLTKLLYSH
jgi:hypothetical protein